MEKIIRDCLWIEFHWALAHATDEELAADQSRADSSYWQVNSLSTGPISVISMN